MFAKRIPALNDMYMEAVLEQTRSEPATSGSGKMRLADAYVAPDLLPWSHTNQS